MYTLFWCGRFGYGPFGLWVLGGGPVCARAQMRSVPVRALFFCQGAVWASPVRAHLHLAYLALPMDPRLELQRALGPWPMCPWLQIRRAQGPLASTYEGPRAEGLKCAGHWAHGPLGPRSPWLASLMPLLKIPCTERQSIYHLELREIQSHVMVAWL